MILSHDQDISVVHTGIMENNYRFFALARVLSPSCKGWVKFICGDFVSPVIIENKVVAALRIADCCCCLIRLSYQPGQCLVYAWCHTC